MMIGTNSGKRKKLNGRLIGFILIMLAPAVLHLLIFWLGVQIKNFQLAFTDVETGAFSGLRNFAYVTDSLFGGRDPYLKESVGNTMLFFLEGIVIVMLSIFASYIIHKKMIGGTFTKILLYLPGAVSSIVMVAMYQQFMQSDGILFTFLRGIGLWGDESFLTDHGVAYIMVYDMWIGLGANLVIWLGSMSRIPDELLECGKLDGISTMKEFLHIVLPLIWPTFVTMITLQIIGIFGASGSVLLLTQGQYGTFTINYWLYFIVLSGQSDVYNYSAATGIFFTLLTIPLVVAGRFFMNRFGEAVEY